MPEKYTILCTAGMDKHPAEKIIPDGILLDMISFTETISLCTPLVKNSIEKFSKESLTVVFTSSKAVKTVIDLLKRPVSWKIYCTNAATLDLVQSFFGREAVLNSAENATLLAEKIISDGIQQAIFFCGNHRRDELPLLLKQHNIELEELFVYETNQTPKQLEKDYDAILFFSPGAVQSFFSLNRLTGKTNLFALGSTTAGAIRKFTDREIIIAPLPDKNILLKMAIDHYSLINN